MSITLDEIVKSVQKFLEDRPLIILGSGASMPYGLPSMRDLGDQLKNTPKLREETDFQRVIEWIDSDGLETAIDKANISESALKTIRHVTWKHVNTLDKKYFFDSLTRKENGLVRLIRKTISACPNTASIVTTNYDRLAEYAIDFIGATVVSGFEGVFYRQFELQNGQAKIKRLQARERTVEIWKVHGSLDWFVDEDNNIISIPLLDNIPDHFDPLIIPPGKAKYSSTHSEPFRTIIAHADKAFLQAGGYLCIGYGFNDTHIQTKLLDQISSGKPIIILTQTMTDACKKIIFESDIKKYVVFEKYNNQMTTVYSNNLKETFEGNMWSLDGFLNLW